MQKYCRGRRGEENRGEERRGGEERGKRGGREGNRREGHYYCCFHDTINLTQSQ